MALDNRSRGAVATFVVAAFTSILVGSALAGGVTGTPKNDVLRGTAKADRISGGGGNDTIYGLAGADKLTGGTGNDRLIGGPGADVLPCGPGRDVAAADALDKPSPDCETITGLPKPDLVVADVTTDEGNNGTKSMEFVVVLGKASPLKATVAFETKDGSATLGSDYAATSGRLTFAPGETKKSITVTVMGDAVVETDETFTVVLSDPVNARLGRATATGTITNEDVPKPEVGHYAGTTSQGRAVRFDVNPELNLVTGLVVNLDVTCPSVGLSLPDEPLEFPPLQLSADWKFGITDSYSDSDGSASIRFAGALSVDGPASDSIRLDLVVNTVIGPVSCSTGDVTWSAQRPA